MKIIRRLTLSLLGVITLVALLVTLFQYEKEKGRLTGELDARATVLGESLVEASRLYLSQEDPKKVRQFTTKFENRKHLRGIALYNEKGRLVAASNPIKEWVNTTFSSVKTALATSAPQKDQNSIGEIETSIHVFPVFSDGSLLGALALFHDTTYITAELRELWKTSFFGFLIQSFLIILTTIAIAHFTLILPLKKSADWVKKLRLNSDDFSWKDAPSKDLFGPLAREVKFMAQSLTEARAAAEEEAKLRLASESQWTPERLKEHVKNTLGGHPLFVVANREPYVHTYVGKEIKAIVPASGLVTALEPILKACGGTWVGHGAGEADRETVDQYDRVRVPPESPLYSIRRVWMTKEEENGYYYGFSNEGLWPLCHIAHTRPVFRPDDWNHYKKINRKFADAVLEELKDTEQPFVLVQDYHFALLPRLIKDKRPDARVALFWHIPWPNPESFGIIPWQREILHGMLGADLLGFHIQYHCNNFLETVDRALESRIDWAQFSVTRDNHRTTVKPFPISVAGTSALEPTETPATIESIKEDLTREHGITARYLGVGVDRIDYTKGILERFRAIERFLEKYPEYQNKFTFIEMGAPSRTLIQTYHELDAEIESEANRINWKLKTKDWKPIVLLKKHHSHKHIERFYRIADVCMVTSLHDGMNLVAKEYIASKDNREGALILSRFAGAAQEFRDALIVNPYDIDQMADAIYYALKMDKQEQRKRMMRMQEIVKENNVYRWGADLISELSQIRIESKTPKKVATS